MADDTAPTDPHLAFHRREWRVQRAGWFGLLAVVIAALAGAFGRGPLSHASVRDAGDELEVRYERFGRFGAAGMLRIRIDRVLMRGGEAAITIDRTLLDGHEVLSIVPPPVRSASDDDAITLTFAAPPVSDGSAWVMVNLKPIAPGRHAGQIGVADGPRLDVATWVYP